MLSICVGYQQHFPAALKRVSRGPRPHPIDGQDAFAPGCKVRVIATLVQDSSCRFDGGQPVDSTQLLRLRWRGHCRA